MQARKSVPWKPLLGSWILGKDISASRIPHCRTDAMDTVHRVDRTMELLLHAYKLLKRLTLQGGPCQTVTVLRPIAPVPDQSQRRQASTSCAIDTSRMKQLQKTVARAKTRKRCNIESVLCGVVPIICNTPQQATLIRTCHRRLREKKSHNRFPPDPLPSQKAADTISYRAK